jgi:chromosome segregation ATPase
MSRAPILRRAFSMLADAPRGLEGVLDVRPWHALVADAGAELDALERELAELRAAVPPSDRPTSRSLEDAHCELADAREREAAYDADVVAYRARVAELEKERAGVLRTLEATREDLAALRAELEARVEQHGQTSRDLVDARAELAKLDAELAACEERARLYVDAGVDVTREAGAERGDRYILEELLEELERELVDFEIVAGADTIGALARVARLVHAAREDLDKRRRSGAQTSTRAQAPKAGRKRSNAAATARAASGSARGALGASTPRKDAKRTRLAKLPPPALAPDKIGPIPPEGEDKSVTAPDPEKSKEVQNG